ncbi:MAG: hypothetical protein ACKOC7_08800, partial [Sphingomonadales bacterium]
MKKTLLLLSLLAWLVLPSYAQLLSGTPLFPRDNDNVSIIVDATKGNGGLNNYSNPSDVYV